MGEGRKISRTGKFMRDLGVYAIGNLGSKLITFLLVPFYTYYIINPADFGYYDLCVNTAFCFIPLIGLQLNEGGFRFLIDTDSDLRRSQIITYIYRTIARNITLILIVSIVVASCFSIRYMWFTIAFGISQTIYDVMLQLVRGLRHTKLFVSAGIINTLLIAVTSVLFLAVMDMGVPGVFYSNIIARVIVVVMLDVKLGLFRKFFIMNNLNSSVGKELIRYSLPLVPAALSWWLLNNNNYYFLQYYCGLSATGFYGIVGRFTGILYILALIFYQTWQQNAIEQYNSKDRDKFFSSVFNNYFFLLMLMTVVYAFGLRLNYSWLVSEQYQGSAQYLFANAIYVVLFSLSEFFVLGYQCSKQTHRILPSLLIAILITFIGNFLLVPRLAIYGVIISSITTWAAMLLYRVIDTRKFMIIHFDTHNFLALVLMLIAGVIYSCWQGIIVDLIALGGFVVIFVCAAPSDFRAKVLARFGRN